MLKDYDHIASIPDEDKLIELRVASKMVDWAQNRLVEEIKFKNVLGQEFKKEELEGWLSIATRAMKSAFYEDCNPVIEEALVKIGEKV